MFFKSSEFDSLEHSTLFSISSILSSILYVDPSKRSMYSGGLTLEFLLIKGTDEIMSTDRLE